MSVIAACADIGDTIVDCVTMVCLAAVVIVVIIKG